MPCPATARARLPALIVYRGVTAASKNLMQNATAIDLYEVYGPEAPEQSFTYLSLNPCC